MTLKYASHGDPLSELNVQRRLQLLRDSQSAGDGVVYLPESLVTADPALERAVAELDWLRIEPRR